jgi:hypothetical protein
MPSCNRTFRGFILLVGIRCRWQLEADQCMTAKESASLNRARQQQLKGFMVDGVSNLLAGWSVRSVQAE